MLGSGARTPTLGFMGWFGPRGLASIVFAVIVVEESDLPHENLIALAIYLTVGLSVFAHGVSAAPLAGRYARWYERHPRQD
jgi:sodium/hydrogen antiporter